MSPTTKHAFEPEEVMAYLDGELDPRRATALAGHLDHCVDCQALANQLRQVSERMLGHQVETPSPKLQDAVRAALDRQDHPAGSASRTTSKLPGRWSRLMVGSFGWALAGALVILLVAAVSVPNLMRSQRRGIGVASGDLSYIDLQPPWENLRGAPPAFRGGRYNKTMATAADTGEEQPDQEEPKEDQQGPLIARAASLSIVAKDFGSVEAAVKAITARYHGYIAGLSTSSPQNTARTLTATLRIPSSQLEAALTELKQLGRVEQESQSGEDVTKQYVDLAARLKNSRATERRLLNVLRNNAGKVKDILETEKEIERVRGEIEEMEADQRALKTRIDFAGLQLSLTEDFKASLHVTPPSTMTRLHNVLAGGFRDVVENVIGLAIWLLEAGPTLLLWAAVLFFPARWVWKGWLRAKLVKPPAASTA
jgi:uncharacterized protein DUF4349/putative zinc finger protein